MSIVRYVIPQVCDWTIRKDQESGRTFGRADAGKVHLIACHNDMAKKHRQSG